MNAYKSQEPDLLLALKKKDPAGIKMLYENYSPALLNIISKIVKDEEPADILQTALIKIWNGVEFYDGQKGRLFTWMLNVTRNCALDVLRSKAYKYNRSLQNIDDCFELVDQRQYTTLNTDAIGLRVLVSKLDPKFREVIELVYLNGFTHPEAAEKLNMKLGTVKTRIRYALALIRREFMIGTA